MKKFPVTVHRTAVQSLEIHVEARTREEAEEKALDMAGSLDFSGKEKEADYAVEVHNIT